jgi:hypothetical protein
MHGAADDGIGGQRLHRNTAAAQTVAGKIHKGHMGILARRFAKLVVRVAAGYWASPARVAITAGSVWWVPISTPVVRVVVCALRCSMSAKAAVRAASGVAPASICAFDQASGRPAVAAILRISTLICARV